MRNADRARLEHLARNVAPDLHAYFARRGVVRQQLDELLSEVFLALASQPHRIPEKAEAARRWAFGVARRVLLAYWRRVGRDMSALDGSDPACLHDPSGFPGDAASAHHQEVRAAIAELTLRQREIVMLVHWEGFSLVDAAHHLGMRPSTARSHYQRAKETLRALLIEPNQETVELPTVTSNRRALSAVRYSSDSDVAPADPVSSG